MVYTVAAAIGRQDSPPPSLSLPPAGKDRDDEDMMEFHGEDDAGPPASVFVHLAHGYDAARWRERWESGELVGVNEPTPYGYGRAEEQGMSLAFSVDGSENALVRLSRLGTRAILGFDLVHAWRNRRAILNADMVWTHTESQFLAIALLFKLTGRKRGERPFLLGQSVWLFDKWRTMSALRRRFFSWLIEEVDILTVHSPRNLELAQALFPEKRCELVLFGINADHKRPPALRPTREGQPFRLLAPGNDRHRDWALAAEALRGLSNAHLTIVSHTAAPGLAAGRDDVTVLRVGSNEELQHLFDTCDAVLVPLKANLHASGSTVLQEAAVNGLPVIATDVGGLSSYFGKDEVLYVPPGDAPAMRHAIETLRDDPGLRLRLAGKAQSRMGTSELSSVQFVRRHVEITRSLLDVPSLSPRTVAKAMP